MATKKGEVLRAVALFVALFLKVYPWAILVTFHPMNLKKDIMIK